MADGRSYPVKNRGRERTCIIQNVDGDRKSFSVTYHRGFPLKLAHARHVPMRRARANGEIE
jgi:hypothetical protein